MTTTRHMNFCPDGSVTGVDAMHFWDLLSLGVCAGTVAEVMVCNRAMGLEPDTPIPPPRNPDPPIVPHADRDDFGIMMAWVRNCETQLEEASHLYDTVSQEHVRNMGHKLYHVLKIAIPHRHAFSYEVQEVASFLTVHHDFVIESILARAEFWSVNRDHPQALCPSDWESYTTLVLGMTALYEYRVSVLEEYYENEITRNVLLLRSDMEYRRTKRRFAAHKMTLAHNTLEFMKSIERINRDRILGSTTKR